MLQFTPSWVGVLTLVVTVILPILTGWATKSIASPGKRAVVLAVLSAVAGFGAELLNALVNNLPYDAFQGGLTAFTAFIIAIALHFGFWKPIGASAKVKDTGGFIG